MIEILSSFRFQRFFSSVSQWFSTELQFYQLNNKKNPIKNNWNCWNGWNWIKDHFFSCFSEYFFVIFVIFWICFQLETKMFLFNLWFLVSFVEFLNFGEVFVRKLYSFEYCRMFAGRYCWWRSSWETFSICFYGVYCSFFIFSAVLSRLFWVFCEISVDIPWI